MSVRPCEANTPDHCSESASRRSITFPLPPHRWPAESLSSHASVGGSNPTTRLKNGGSRWSSPCTRHCKNREANQPEFSFSRRQSPLGAPPANQDGPLFPGSPRSDSLPRPRRCARQLTRLDRILGYGGWALCPRVTDDTPIDRTPIDRCHLLTAATRTDRARNISEREPAGA